MERDSPLIRFIFLRSHGEKQNDHRHEKPKIKCVSALVHTTPTLHAVFHSTPFNILTSATTATTTILLVPYLQPNFLFFFIVHVLHSSRFQANVDCCVGWYYSHPSMMSSDGLHSTAPPPRQLTTAMLLPSMGDFLLRQ